MNNGPMDTGSRPPWLPWNAGQTLGRLMNASANIVPILLVTDDQHMAENLRDALEGAPVTTTATREPERLFQEVADRLPRTLLLDGRLLAESIPLICQRLRSSRVTADVPIIVITAPEASSERIRALESGADDCVATPLDIPELVARIRAKTRQGGPPAALGHLHAGPIDLDLDRWTASVSGESLSLTKKEFLLLQTLIESRGRTLTREYLLKTVWSLRAMVETRTVDVHIARLRRKLGPTGRYIVTVRNVGFRLDLMPEWLTQHRHRDDA